MDNTAKLELTIDLSNKEQTAAFANLFLALAGQTQTSVVAEETSKTTKKVDSPKKETPKQEPAKTVETPAAHAAEEAPEKAQEAIKIEDVRALLSTKVTDHRDSIKEKLTSFGANNVTSLKPEHYSEFVDFLNSL